MTRIIFAVFALQGLCLPALAAFTCVKTPSEYNEKNSELPAFLQKLPAMMVTDSMLVTAGLKLKAAGDRLKLEGYVWKPNEVIINDAYIKNACFDGKSLKVTLDNDKIYDAKLGDKAVKIDGFQFDESSEYKFAGVVEKIKAEQKKRNSRSSSDSSSVAPGVR